MGKLSTSGTELETLGDQSGIWTDSCSGQEVVKIHEVHARIDKPTPQNPDPVGKVRLLTLNQKRK